MLIVLFVAPLIQYQCLTAVDALQNLLGSAQMRYLKSRLEVYLDSPRMMSVFAFDSLCAREARRLQEKLGNMLRYGSGARERM